MFVLLKGAKWKMQQICRLFAGKLSMEQKWWFSIQRAVVSSQKYTVFWQEHYPWKKKSLHFWIKPTLDLSQKYIKCFGGKNCALCSLTRQKNGYILTFDKALFKIAEFFFLFGTLHSQITFSLISRPLLKAHIFFTWFVKKTQ